MSVHGKDVKSGGVKPAVHHDEPQKKVETPKKPVAKPLDQVVKSDDRSQMAKIFTQNLGQPDPQKKLAQFDYQRAKDRYVKVVLKQGAAEHKPEEVSRKKAQVNLKSAQAGFGGLMLSPAQNNSEVNLHKPKKVEPAVGNKGAKTAPKKPGLDTGALRGHAHG